MLPVYHTLWAFAHTRAHRCISKRGEPRVVFHTHIHRKQSDRRMWMCKRREHNINKRMKKRHPQACIDTAQVRTHEHTALGWRSDQQQHRHRHTHTHTPRHRFILATAPPHAVHTLTSGLTHTLSRPDSLIYFSFFFLFVPYTLFFIRL